MVGQWRSSSLNRRPRRWQSKALVYDNSSMRVDVVDVSESKILCRFLESHQLISFLVKSHPEKFTKTAAAGKGDSVDIYLNVTIGKNAPIKYLYTTADLSKLDLSTRVQRWRGKFDYIYIRGTSPADAEARTSGCFE